MAKLVVLFGGRAALKPLAFPALWTDLPGRRTSPFDIAVYCEARMFTFGRFVWGGARGPAGMMLTALMCWGGARAARAGARHHVRAGVVHFRCSDRWRWEGGWVRGWVGAVGAGAEVTMSRRRLVVAQRGRWHYSTWLATRRPTIGCPCLAWATAASGASRSIVSRGARMRYTTCHSWRRWRANCVSS